MPKPWHSTTARSWSLPPIAVAAFLASVVLPTQAGFAQAAELPVRSTNGPAPGETSSQSLGPSFLEAVGLAPRFKRQRPSLWVHEERRLPPILDLRPDRPTRFPRELLSYLIENELEIDDPVEEFSLGPVAPDQPWGSPDPDRLVPNRRINDPTRDGINSCQSENALAVRGNYLVAGWNDQHDTEEPKSASGYGYSSDGGATWTDGGTLPRAGTNDFFFGDPCVTVDDEGNFYYASLYTPDSRRVAISVSRGRFQGRSFAFDPPVAAIVSTGGLLDKEWLAVDPVSGALYVTYTRFIGGRQQIELVRSLDRGQTWSAPLVLSDRARWAVQGSRPAVGPDHEVYVVWYAVDRVDASAHMRIRKSTDQGQSFGPEVNVGEAPDESTLYVNATCGTPGYNRVGGPTLPSIAVDRRAGRERGTVYVTWAEAVNFYDDELGGAAVVSEIENNDAPFRATRFEPGVTLSAWILTGTDADWYAFEGRAGQTVEFFLTPYLGLAADAFIRLYCQRGSIADRLAVSYVGNGQGFIIFTLPADATYYLRVAPVNADAALGRYFVYTGIHAPRPEDVARDARDVVVARSRDGIHWKRREVVNTDLPHFDNAFPEVAVDGLGGVHFVWYDHRNDAACGVLTDVYHAHWRKRDAGHVFEAVREDRRVNDGPSINWNLVSTTFVPNMGDYIALAADGRDVYAHWADARLGTPDSWVANLTMKPGRGRRVGLEPVAWDGDDEPSDEEVVADERLVNGGAAESVQQLHVLQGAWGTPLVAEFAVPSPGAARLDLYSVAGQRVRTLFEGPSESGASRVTWDRRAENGAPAPAGVYFLVLRQGTESITRRVVLGD